MSVAYIKSLPMATKWFGKVRNKFNVARNNEHKEMYSIHFVQSSLKSYSLGVNLYIFPISWSNKCYFWRASGLQEYLNIKVVFIDHFILEIIVRKKNH